MSVATSKLCWNCNEAIEEDAIVCLNCGMGQDVPQDVSSSPLDELDALLEDTANEPITEIEADLDELLQDDELSIDDILDSELEDSIDDLNLSDSLDSEEIDTTSLSSPEVPDFDTLSTSVELPDFDTLEEPSSSTLEEIPLEDPSTDVVAFKKPKSSEIVYDLPQFPELEQPLKEETIAEEVEITSVPIKKNRIFLSIMGQYLYWFFIFLTTAVVAVDLIDPNVPIVSLQRSQLEINHLFFLGAAFYLPFGWFFGYKLEQWQFERNWQFATVYIIGFFLCSTLIRSILLAISSSELFSLYILYGWYLTWSSLFFGGLLFFLLGYRFLYEAIENLSPHLRIRDILSA